MSSSLGWECERCTYHHNVPGTRCVMCDQLRVTKKQMRDFVMGKTLPKNKTDKEKKETTTKENRPPPPASSVPKPAPAIRNPYAKKTSAPATAVPTKPPPQNGMQSSLFSQSSGLTVGGNAAGTSAVARQPQVQSHFTSGKPPVTNNGQSAFGNSSTLPPPRNTASIGHNVPPASSHALPTTMKPPPAAAGYPQQSRGQQLNDTRGTSRSNVTRIAAQPMNRKPPPNAKEKKNPFTLAKRPAPTPYAPGPVPLCSETASDWIYPVHEQYPIRDYQLEISGTAVLYNTLVSLPTGLGKTLIASVVLYNFYRWFPTGKVIFLAPTLPLVNQQVKACYDIMGIPAEDTALLTGKVAAKDRKGLWIERRVFFCTPQTVQRDIESDRCPAREVVCVVLDEAHKASGAYAYVKVVQYLEEAGAKFRILGLSATPGTGIKAIQEVVTTLRIQKIEARLEDDPSVKKYIHERHSEIIIVKQVSVVNTIDRMMTDLLTPILERLRGYNGLSVVQGNATLTPYCLIRAKNEYQRRTNDHSLDSYFFAANTLLQLRTDLRCTGIGMARNKVIQLRNQAKGFMTSIVRGKEYQAMMDAVLQASSDPNNINERAEDRKLNNPKLMKLDEILTEHFERARACGNSSRAIVFTQWRDSVSEIVAVLASNQPLLRARHFVGQGKSTGGANKQRIDQSCVSLKGMKQKEQQAVIREFREGKYNVLVCTCIGEEGLDIGEVDLIVNYDSLRSPIRMIQRVGRTGRKRDGRVVCLVSEGAEEKTMTLSKNAERTLGRALKKPDSFQVVRSSPMFPRAPVLRKLDMSVAKDFHMSQVGGNGLASRSTRDTSDSGKVRHELTMSWRLNEAQERQREAMFGSVSSSICFELRPSKGQMSQALRKRLLRARTRSISTYENRKKPVPNSFGGCRRVLLQVERKYGQEVARRTLVNGGLGRSRGESGALQQLFPLERSSETDTLDRGFLMMSLSVAESSNPPPDESVLRSTSASPSLPLTLHRNGSSQHQDGTTAPEQMNNYLSEAARPQNPYLSQTDESRIRTKKLPGTRQEDALLEDVAENIEARNIQSVSAPPTDCDELRLPTPPVSSSEDSESDEDSTEEKMDPKPQTEVAAQAVIAEQSSMDNIDAEVASEAHESHGLPLPVRLIDTMCDDSLRLPTQESSSDDESSEHESTDDLPPSHPVSSREIFKPPDEISIDHAMVEIQHSVQRSSKEDGELERKVSQVSKGRNLCEGKEERPSSMEYMEIGAGQNLVDTPDDNWPRRPLLSKDPASKISRTPLAAPPSADDAGAELIDTPTPLAPPNSSADAGSELIDTPTPLAAPPSSDDAGAELIDTPTPLAPPNSSDDAGSELIDTPQLLATHVAALRASADSGADLVDTPQSEDVGGMPPPPARTMMSHDSQCTASKDDADEVVCSICFDGACSDDNPLVRCDGASDDQSCPIAVHQLCYSISGSLDDIDNWYCDVCAFRRLQRQGKKRATMQCFVCHKEDGPLKQMPDSSGQSWFHPHCRYAVVDEEAFCQYCASKGGTRCAFEGCTEYAHPHCGLKLNKPWLVIAYASDTTASSLTSDYVIGCNIYCPHHRDQVCCSLARVGANASATSASPRYVIVSSKLRDLNAGTAPTGAVQRKRLRKKVKVDKSATPADKSADESVDSVDVREQKRQRVLERMKERTNGLQRCRFIDLEVDVDSDEDADGDHGEEAEARQIEEEENFYKDFINDSSQLGYTQDDLDRLAMSENAATPAESGAVHRRVDVMRERMNQFATPVLNRRMYKHGRGRESAATETPSNGWDQPTPASSSQKGLGNMHFIRSVLEHARNGGEADDIEEVYHSVAQEASPLEDRAIPERDPAGPIVMRYVASSEESDDSDEEEMQENAQMRSTARGSVDAEPSRTSPSAANRAPDTGLATNGVLTAEQRAMIEKKRQEALRRRQQYQAQNKTG